MGFTIPHIRKAIRNNDSNNSGEFRAQKLNKLAVWLLEHPDIETRFGGKILLIAQITTIFIATRGVKVTVC